MKNHTFHLEVLPHLNLIESTAKFICDVSSLYESNSPKQKEMQYVLERILEFIFEHTEKNFHRHHIDITGEWITQEPEVTSSENLKEKTELFEISFANHSNPISEGHLTILERLHKYVHSFKFENKGRDGQKLSLFYFNNKKLFSTPADNAQAIENKGNNTSLPSVQSTFTYRNLTEEDAYQIPQLFFSTYGYNYVDNFVYSPDEIKLLMAQEKLFCVGAFDQNNRLVANLGLKMISSKVKVQGNLRAYVGGLALVHPLLKANGVFKELNKYFVEFHSKIPMAFLQYDFVTNHAYAQREAAKSGLTSLNISVGSQVSKLQAKLSKIGIGHDSKNMLRYSLITGIMVRKENPHPFGKEVILPNYLGEKLEFLLKPLGINWKIASRFYPLPAEGQVDITYNESQKAVHFYIREPGFSCIEEIAKQWSHDLKEGFKYASIDIPLYCSGLASFYEYFSQIGFFISGFMPYPKENQVGFFLCFRIQSNAPTKVALDQIKIGTLQGRKLFEIIKKDYSKNNDQIHFL